MKAFGKGSFECVLMLCLHEVMKIKDVLVKNFNKSFERVFESCSVFTVNDLKTLKI